MPREEKKGHRGKGGFRAHPGQSPQMAPSYPLGQGEVGSEDTGSRQALTVTFFSFGVQACCFQDLSRHLNTVQ